MLAAAGAAGFLYLDAKNRAFKVDRMYVHARESDLDGDYNAARELYLRTIALSPRHADARAALVSLTARAGARAEALHHLARLEQLVGPSDPRVVMWRAKLGPGGD